MCCKGFLFDIKKNVFALFSHKQFWRYYDSYCRISRLREQVKKNLNSKRSPAKGWPPPPLKNATFFLNIKKCLECSETKEYATTGIFCDISFRVPVIKVKTFQIFS